MDSFGRYESYAIAAAAKFFNTINIIIKKTRTETKGAAKAEYRRDTFPKK